MLERARTPLEAGEAKKETIDKLAASIDWRLHTPEHVHG
jgi:hypothetical protein